eukprot:354266-Chlamydomonas_euryale.AAC.25
MHQSRARLLLMSGAWLVHLPHERSASSATFHSMQPPRGAAAGSGIGGAHGSARRVAGFEPGARVRRALFKRHTEALFW